MTLHYTTPTPNSLYDVHLPLLSEAELKVLLIVIRQTYGWIDVTTRKRKKRDRITIGYFKKKTGLSRKAISQAISSLTQKKLIIPSTAKGSVLHHPYERKGKVCIYYACCLQQEQNVSKPSVKSTQHPITKGNITKETHTKERKIQMQKKTSKISNQLRRLSDRERCLQIIAQQKRNN